MKQPPRSTRPTTRSRRVMAPQYLLHHDCIYRDKRWRRGSGGSGHVWPMDGLRRMEAESDGGVRGKRARLVAPVRSSDLMCNACTKCMAVNIMVIYRMHILDLTFEVMGCVRIVASACVVLGTSVELMEFRMGKRGSPGWSSVSPALFGALGEIICVGCCWYRG